MREVVKQPKIEEPFPGSWTFSTDLYISPLQPGQVRSTKKKYELQQTNIDCFSFFVYKGGNSC